jgi:hypothetical protein
VPIFPNSGGLSLMRFRFHAPGNLFRLPAVPLDSDTRPDQPAYRSASRDTRAAGGMPVRGASTPESDP